MGVKTYSLSKDGSKRLSRDFQVREFACKDGSDKILIDEKLVECLQKIRDHFCKPVSINSAYRTAAHNKKVGGSSNSQHVQGRAADIRIYGCTPLVVAQYAETLGMGGIGLYATFTHVDTRAGKVRWDQRSGRQKVVSGFGGQVAQTPEKPKQEDEEMTRWKTLADIPTGYYRKEAERLIKQGVLRGKENGEIDITEDMLRTILIIERMLK